MTAFSLDVGRFGRFVATTSGVVWLRVGVVLRLVEDLRSRPDESFGEDLECFASFGLKEMNGGEHDQREERGDQRVNASEILESLLLARRLVPKIARGLIKEAWVKCTGSRTVIKELVLSEGEDEPAILWKRKLEDNTKARAGDDGNETCVSARFLHVQRGDERHNAARKDDIKRDNQ